MTDPPKNMQSYSSFQSRAERLRTAHRKWQQSLIDAQERIAAPQLIVEGHLTRMVGLTLEAVGYYGTPDFRSFPADGSNDFPIGPDYAHSAAPTYFNMRKTSIYGGSNEIQRNIITKMVLGL